MGAYYSLLLTALVPADPSPPTAVEQAVLATRQSIRTAHLVVEVDTRDRRDSEHLMRYRYETWYEANRQRTDITPLDDSTRQVKGRISFDRFSCRNCPEPGMVVGQMRGGSPVTVTRPDVPALSGADEAEGHLGVVNLGLIMYPASIVHR